MSSPLRTAASRPALLRRTPLSSHLARLTRAAVQPGVGQMAKLPSGPANPVLGGPREGRRAGEEEPLALLRSPPPGERLGGQWRIGNPPPSPQEAVDDVVPPHRTARVHPPPPRVAREPSLVQVGGDERSPSLTMDQEDSRRNHTLSQNTPL